MCSIPRYSPCAHTQVTWSHSKLSLVHAWQLFSLGCKWLKSQCLFQKSVMQWEATSSQLKGICNAGSEGSLYNGSSIVCDPPTRVNSVRTGIANKSDCTQAVSQLRAKDVANCSALNNTNAPSEYSGNPATPLVTVGGCQVLLGAGDGQTLSCSQVAEYASNLTIACSNSQMGIGGAVYPFRLPNGYSPGAAIFLACTVSHV